MIDTLGNVTMRKHDIGFPTFCGLGFSTDAGNGLYELQIVCGFPSGVFPLNVSASEPLSFAGIPFG